MLHGLGKEYDTLVGIITHFPGSLSLEELKTKLLLHEQQLQRFKDIDPVVSHQAFATQNLSSNSSNISGNQSPPQGSCGKVRSFSSKGRGRGGRSRVSFSRSQQHQVATGNSFTHGGFSRQSSSGIGSIPTASYISPSVNVP